MPVYAQLPPPIFPAPPLIPVHNNPFIPFPPPKVRHVHFYSHDIYVTLANNSIHVNQWISVVLRLYNNPFCKVVVGLDTEWLPNLDPDDDHPTATLQLCIGNHCLLFQLLHTDCIPLCLHAFLANPRFLFCGVGIEDDVKKLYNFHGLGVGSTKDLNDLLKLTPGGIHFKYLGLKKMAAAVLGKEMDKPLNVTLSCWDAAVLDNDQIEYAAIDAFVSSQLALRMCSLMRSAAEASMHLR